MNKLLLATSLLACLGFASNASALECAAKNEAKAAEPVPAQAAAPKAPVSDGTCTIGDAKLTLPPPDAAIYVDMPASMRSGMEASLPPSNRLLNAYLNKNDATGASSASVQTLKPLEQAVLKPEDFAQMVAQSKAMMGGTSLQDAIKSVDKNNLVAGQPKVLGILFEREDAFATAILIGANTPNGTLQIVVASAMLRVKGKVLALALTEPYKDEKTVESMKTELDAWSAKIAAANK